MRSQRRLLPSLFLFLGLFFLFGCSVKGYSPTEESEVKPWEEGSIFGGEGITLFSRGRTETDRTDQPSSISVNSFLWRASLITLSFLPITSADPFGGVIITDWYASGDSSDERFKLNVYILSSVLRSDAIKVSVFRQTQEGDNWRDAPTSPDTALQLENIILTHARRLWIQYF